MITPFHIVASTPIKIFFLVITIFIFLINSSHAILEVKKLPYEDAEIEKIYKLDNGKFIYIEQFVRGHIIWEYDPEKDKFKEISKVWAFICLLYTSPSPRDTG